MWNRVYGERGFDTDKVLPYLERLIVVIRYHGSSKDHRIGFGIEDAYIHQGDWYRMNPKIDDHPHSSDLIDLEVNEVVAWTEFPKELVREQCKLCFQPYKNFDKDFASHHCVLDELLNKPPNR